MRGTIVRVAAAALFALASTVGAAAQDALGDIMWRFRDNPEEGVRRLAFAVEELGMDVNGGVQDGDSGTTPLCKSRRAEFARELVRLGAIPRGAGDGSWTLYECAALYAPLGDTALIAWLIDELGTDVNEMDSIAGDGTPLCAFAKYGDPVQVKELLARGADPNLHVAGDSTTHPLVCALLNLAPWEETMQIIEALKDAGSSLPESN